MVNFLFIELVLSKNDFSYIYNYENLFKIKLVVKYR